MSGQRNETELFWSAENVINRRSTGLRTAEPKPLKRTFRSAIVISALPPEADIGNVRLWPEADSVPTRPINSQRGNFSGAQSSLNECYRPLS
jgi:hypothetical protein